MQDALDSTEFPAFSSKGSGGLIASELEAPFSDWKDFKGNQVKRDPIPVLDPSFALYPNSPSLASALLKLKSFSNMTRVIQYMPWAIQLTYLGGTLSETYSMGSDPIFYILSA